MKVTSMSQTPWSNEPSASRPDEHGYQQPTYGEPGYQQPTYGPPQYGYGAAPSQMGYSTQSLDADKASQLSLIFGILGIVVLPIVFGPLAIWQANKSERLGKPATAGKVLGWIGTIMAIVAVLFIGVIVIAAIAGSTGY